MASPVVSSEFLLSTGVHLISLARRRPVRVGELRNTILAIALQDQRGDFLDAAEIFNLEILDVNMCFEVLFNV